MHELDFKWLHLSDLHVGMGGQAWLWPTFKHSLFDDFKKIHSTTGDWDVVIFSGDLTQGGSREEFYRLDEILSELWDNFRKLGFSPMLAVAPGNHDLARPPASEPEVMLLRKWWDEQLVREDFFSSVPNRYRTAVDTAFGEYTAWYDRLHASGIPTIRAEAGVLPGDQSLVIKKEAGQVGVVILNSAWLQLGPGDYKGMLHVDPKQLLAVTGNNPVAWCRSNTFNILVTHHPVDWLSGKSQAYWYSDINPPGRFGLHLFGHMHDAQAATSAIGGSAPRTSIQAASIFGLETVGGEIAGRSHGYSVARLRTTRDQQEVRIWPRRLHQLASGERKLVPDFNFNLGRDDISFVALRRDLNSPDWPCNGAAPQEASSVRIQPVTTNSDEVLRKAKYHFVPARAHANVRRVEQQKCIANLLETRAVWLVAEWGMGADGFVSTIQKHRQHASHPTYRLDLSDYTSREQFFDLIKQSIGCSFERFCEILSSSSPAYLLLDDPPTDIAVADGKLTREQDIENLVRTILEYCPELTIFIRCRRTPQHQDLAIIEIKPLDEADVRTYVSEHERGGAPLCTAEVVGALYRHTDGIPVRLDASLKDLEVIELSELVNTDSDILVASTSPTDAPPVLSRVVQELADSTNPTLQRAFDLLKALTLFPQGEQLTRIKRFFAIYAFFPVHARELLDQGLIDASVNQRLGTDGADASAKMLVVPRPIRECVRDRIGPDELTRLNRKAADLYFGQGWPSGVLKQHSGYHFDDPHCPSAYIANATTIIIRLLRESRSTENLQAIAAALRLTSSYIAALSNGDHYRSVVSICKDTIALVPDSGFEQQRSLLNYELGKALRMIGEHKRAKAVLEDAAGFKHSKSTRQSILLSLAFCHQALDESDEAIAAAKEVIKIDRYSGPALQGQTILVDLTEESAQREQKLERLEALSRKRGALVVANNIALSRAEDADGEPDRVRSILGRVLQSAGNSEDFYNETRAMIGLSELALNAGERLSDADQSRLIGSYHFLFNERFSSLFDRCHAALWKTFSARNDLNNLLSLFRHSSLVWRLRGHEKMEKKYLGQLKKKGGERIVERF